MPNDRVSDPHDSRVRQLDRAQPRSQPAGGLRRLPPIYLGHCVATRRVQAELHRALHTSAPVLVSGASGTGKRTIAEILHYFSDVEAPLQQPAIMSGQLELADGFVYLCPVEQLSREQQLALLETHDQARARLVLGTRLALDSDATWRRIEPLLHGCPIHIELPTLRQRIEDLEALALRILCETPSRRPIGGIDDYALDCLRAHSWPGNVTELEEVLQHAIEVGTAEQIELRDLPAHLRLHAVHSAELDIPDLEFSLAHAERSAIERAVRFARGNKRKAARLLRISKTTLYRKLRHYDALDDDEVDDEP
jgi:DNA-binding NtrC family response regulator